MIRKHNIPEILAPCGSYDILVAAVKAGADACYIGGSRFGARAYAGNLDSDSIVKAIDYAHLHGVKLYLTVNTLFKNTEIQELKNYLMPYYEAGIDAFIVQDLGVFDVLRHIFPDISIHCSTQMNINSVHGAEFMKNMGASRVVTAREMTLAEIKKIKDMVDIEIETFVHGAMCYSYSGQCLLSSVAGERSGNRGRCAQPCRKCYDDSYILSMKDMCALELIPKLIDCKIDSLKIEGRMKNEYYVASAVDAYRQVRDDYLDGNYNISRIKKLKDGLANIYNRGGFSDGYFYFENSRSSKADMISRKRPNNQGVLIGKAVSVKEGRVGISLNRDLYPGDVLELMLNDNTSIDVTASSGGRKGTVVYIAAPKTRRILMNTAVYRTRCKKLIEEIEKDILSDADNYGKIHIDGVYEAHVNDTERLTLSCIADGEKLSVTAFGDIISKAEKVSTDAQTIIDKISQLGATDYCLDSLTVDISDMAFVPVGKVKKLRREALASLEKQITSKYRRFYSDLESMGDYEPADYSVNDTLCEGVHVNVLTMEQLEAALEYDYVTAVYMDKYMYDKAYKEGLIKKITENDIKIYICLPYIIDSSFLIDKYLPKDNISGIYIRNIDSLSIIIKNRLYETYSCICQASLYGYNNEARAFIAKNCPGMIFELPKELTLRELKELYIGYNIYNIYGCQQVMISRQCIFRNKYSCNHNHETTIIKDDKSNRFICRSVCEECCNVIYNGIPFNMLDKKGDLKKYIKADAINICFTTESKNQAHSVLKQCSDYMLNDTTVKQRTDKMFTTGHSYRGVE